ncbi:MAG: GYF domain-containing protein [Desulfotignum sp.]|nr:GYF domain-containing protein [Desulfotignum sp.]MCF8137113.1 GYF domain-containing protein [Desulfotignum sp.]
MDAEQKQQTSKIEPAAPPAEQYKRIRPTLYIGIGGTGKEIMLRLRRRILQTLWNGKRIESMEDFPVAAFLYFDTYTGKAEDERRQGKKGSKQDPLRRLIELPARDCIQKGLDIDKYLRGEEIERYPHIKEWLPEGELRAIRADQGAGQVRSVARLLFFDDVENINAAIKIKASALLQNVGNDRLKALGLEIEDQVKIVVLCSIAGGTGAGAFIDMGYLCKSLMYPKPAEVNLYALTGGAFSALKERVMANSYAALTELEYCMRDSLYGTYVKSWAKGLNNEASRPYDDVYLVDNTNFVHQSTGDRNHLYGMIADALYEELHDPVLRGKRREDLVNQTEFKQLHFVPTMSKEMEKELGACSQRFSRSYSSFGQVTLYTQGRTQFERETAEAARDMIQAFFRMAEYDKVNHPTGPEVTDFLATQLHLEDSGYFQDFPDFIPGAKERSLADFPLVDNLMQQGDTRLDRVMSDHVRSGFAELRESGRDLSEWRAQAELIRQTRERDIEGAVDSAAYDATYPRALKEQRRRIMNEFAGKNGLRNALYARLDNREKGGLSYTISLIREVRGALTVEGTGVCHRLSKTAQELDKLATELRQGYYTRALTNLEKAARKGLLRGSDREACLRFLGQAEEAMRYYLYYRLRALACREAIVLLRDEVIAELGQPSAMGEGSETGATGIMAEFERGRAAVRAALGELEAEIRVLDDTTHSSTPLRNFIPGGGMPEAEGVNRAQLAKWGAEALAEFGGSRELFEQLRDDKQRPRIISTLRGRARENMQALEQQLPTVRQALEVMPPAERKNLFREAFRNAMPWVNCDIEKIKENCWKPQMISSFVAVEDAPEFLQRFKEEIQPVLPPELQNKELFAVSSGQRGRLVIYSELSGLPLNALIALHDDWWRAYKQASEGEQMLPLHNHRKVELFQQPTEMSLEKLRILHDKLKLYLKGVGLGLLRRRSEPDGRYAINAKTTHVADWLAIGREQHIYLKKDFPEGKEGLLRRQVEDVEQRMSTMQKLLAAALFYSIAHQSYAPRMVTMAGTDEKRHGGIAHHAALAVAKEYTKQFDAAPERSAIAAETGALLASLDECRNSWALEIKNSSNDTTPQEANFDPKHGPVATDKWSVDFTRHSDDEIRQLAGLKARVGETSNPTSSGVDDGSRYKGGDGTEDGVPPPLPGGPKYHLALNNKKLGPFTMDELKAKQVSGELEIAPDTLVWRKGLKTWQRVGEFEELFDLLGDDEPPPIPEN